MAITALVGAASILVIGLMLMTASPALRTQPQTWILLGIGAWLFFRRVRALSTMRG